MNQPRPGRLRTTPASAISRGRNSERGAGAARVVSPAQLIARAQKKARADRVTALFLGTLRARSLPMPVAEHRFDLERKWRFDYAWPSFALAVEQEGLFGRHQRTAGFLGDMEKYRVAVLCRWYVLRFTTREMTSGLAAEWVEAFLAGHAKGKR